MRHTHKKYSRAREAEKTDNNLNTTFYNMPSHMKQKSDDCI
jgi:hypothetical protein